MFDIVSGLAINEPSDYNFLPVSYSPHRRIRDLSMVDIVSRPFVFLFSH